REAKRVDAQLAHQRDVVRVAVVEVARDFSRVAVPDLSRRRAEAVPDALAAPILACCPLDLVRRRRGAPDEVVWEGARIGGHRFPLGQVDGAVTWQRADCRGWASTSGGVTCEQT